MKLTILTLESRVCFNFAGIVFAARACLCKKQWVTCKVGISLFIRAAKPERFPSIEGTPSVHTDPIISRSISFSLKKFLTNSNTSMAVVVVFKDAQNKKSSTTNLSLTYQPITMSWLQLDTSVDSSNWIGILTGLAFILETTWSRISLLISEILVLITLLDKGICCNFFSAYLL